MTIVKVVQVTNGGNMMKAHIMSRKRTNQTKMRVTQALMRVIQKKKLVQSERKLIRNH